MADPGQNRHYQRHENNGSSGLLAPEKKHTFIDLLAASGELDLLMLNVYGIIASLEDRATQACDPSAKLVAIQRGGPDLFRPFTFPRWKPEGDKRIFETSTNQLISKGFPCIKEPINSLGAIKPEEPKFFCSSRSTTRARI